MAMNEKRCGRAGCEVVVERRGATYCSTGCYHTRNHETRKCAFCGKPSSGPASKLRKFCSKSCASKSVPSKTRLAAWDGRRVNTGECSVRNCERRAKNGGLCDRHYAKKLQKDPHWDAPIRAKARAGEGTITRGYRVLRVNGKYRAEHRLIAEQLLGRPLARHEDVHHRDGNGLNNAVDGPFRLNSRGNLVSGNLEVWVYRTQPRGQEVGPRLDEALALLGQYREFLTPRMVDSLVRLSVR